MKSKTTLSLIEQVLMLLFFALAAAVCLRIFAHAGEISADTRRQSEALSIAEEAAEQLRAGKAPDEIVISEETADELRLQTMPWSGETEFLGGAEVSVYDGDRLLLSLPVRWQK